MLKSPYSSYKRLYIYHVDKPDLPPLDDPDLIGAWREGKTTVLFFHRAKDELLAKECERHGCSIIYGTEMDHRDWENGTNILPFAVGPLRVAPLWDSSPGDIVLDPSVIFGNGFHPTTRLCLESLVELSERMGPFNSVQDLGCGTAILGIAAAKLASKNVVAVDENSLAVQVARANISRNGVESVVQVVPQDLSVTCLPSRGVDLVMANLFHDLLVDMFKNPDFWHARYYIISGFFVARLEGLLSCLPKDKVSIINCSSREPWGCLFLARK